MKPGESGGEGGGGCHCTDPHWKISVDLLHFHYSLLHMSLEGQWLIYSLFVRLKEFHEMFTHRDFRGSKFG